MVPDDFHDFFVATAGASAALIGLLFVAITVRPQWLIEEETRAQSQTQAGSALISFSNVLMLSTVALIPGANIGYVALPLGVGGLLFCVARARTLFAARQRGHAGPTWLLLVLGLVVVSVYQTWAGVRLIVSPNSVGGVTTIAGLIVGSLSIGIGRSWRLVGMQDTGMVSSVSTLLHGDAPVTQSREARQPD